MKDLKRRLSIALSVLYRRNFMVLTFNSTGAMDIRTSAIRELPSHDLFLITEVLQVYSDHLKEHQRMQQVLEEAQQLIKSNH